MLFGTSSSSDTAQHGFIGTAILQRIATQDPFRLSLERVNRAMCRYPEGLLDLVHIVPLGRRKQLSLAAISVPPQTERREHAVGSVHAVLLFLCTQPRPISKGAELAQAPCGLPKYQGKQIHLGITSLLKLGNPIARCDGPRAISWRFTAASTSSCILQSTAHPP